MKFKRPFRSIRLHALLWFNCYVVRLHSQLTRAFASSMSSYNIWCDTVSYF